MEWLLLLLSGGAGTYAAWRVRGLHQQRRERTRALEVARSLAEEDVTCLGEQLTALAADLGDQDLDEEARETYQLALDSYERATREVARLHDVEEVRQLVDTLDTGRHALACVRAANEGRERPERRVPCFFNPQHGPSVRDVMWTPRGRGTRLLPACRQCAARVEARERPDVRTVRVGSLQVPYWEAGSLTLPYGYAHFAAAQPTGPSVSWVAETAFTGDWDLGHYGDWSHHHRGRVGELDD